MHDLYIFGSVARGEMSPTSDIDVLVIPLGNEPSQYPNAWSVYVLEFGFLALFQAFKRSRCQISKYIVCPPCAGRP